MILILVVLVVVIVLLALRPWARRRCAWAQDPRKLADGRDLWVCATCGASEAVARGRVPSLCKAER